MKKLASLYGGVIKNAFIYLNFEKVGLFFIYVLNDLDLMSLYFLMKKKRGNYECRKRDREGRKKDWGGRKKK